MSGLNGALRAVQGYLEAAMPAKVLELEARLGYGEGELPRPVLITTGEQPRLESDDWPALVVTGRDAGTTDLEGDDGALEYRATYSLRVLLFVRAAGTDVTPGEVLVQRLRNDLQLAVRELFLTRPKLDAWAPGPGKVDPTQLRESYSELGADTARRSIAASYVDVRAIMTETIPAGDDDVLGVVDTLTVHPALL